MMKPNPILNYKDNYNMNIINSYRFSTSSGFIQYGLYNEAEFIAKINDGYIPVASATEMDNLRTTTLQTMGVGSPFEGEYTTGLDKKYVQYIGIDLSAFSNWTQYGSWYGIFDGNEIATIGLTSFNIARDSLFGIIEPGASAINMILYGNIGNGSETFLAGYCGANFGTIDNCVFNGSINGTSRAGGICSSPQIDSVITNCTANITITATGDSVGGISGTAIGLIENCTSSGTIISSVNNVGGIFGSCSNVAITNILNCSSSCNVTGSRYVGGIFGSASTSATNLLIDKCSATGNITGTDTATASSGGAIGEMRAGVISNCYATGNVVGVGARSAGFISDLYSAASVTNCYATGNVSGATTNGGFAAYSAGAITNSYWDTVASGNPTSVGGIGKTTIEMQQGLIPDTAIFVDWSPLVWDEVDNSSYPILLD